MTERMPLAREALKYKMFGDDVVLFDIQVARDVISEDLGIDFSTVGPVRLPYPKLFMEYHEPMLGDGTNPDLPFKIGFLITDSDDHYLITMEPFYLYPGEGPLRANIFLEYSLDKDGLLVYQTKEFDSSRHEAFVDNGNGSTEVTVTWDDRCKFGIETIREFTPVICAMARVSLVALGLINCRNVKTEELGRFSVKRSGTDKRRGVPPKEVRYSTILLPGGGSERTGSGSGTHHRASAVHRVRGHFKTYTADAPLMGKHVGTYWWGWQIRGSVESGVVESDYRLGA